MTVGLHLERSGAVAKLSLDRPEVGNAIDLATARAFLDAAISCDSDASVRAIIITGKGRLFCAGGDVAAFAAAGDALPTLLKEITIPLHAALQRLLQMKKPIVSAINGPAAGAGIGLAIAADIAIAARSARFSLAYSAIGMTPDAGVTWLLPRLIGLRRAQELCLTNRRLTAEEALAIGMISQVVDDAELEARAMEVAENLAAGPVGAFGAIRRLLFQGSTNGLAAQLDLESESIARQGGSSEGREGVAAFLEKRPAVFHAAT